MLFRAANRQKIEQLQVESIGTRQRVALILTREKVLEEYASTVRAGDEITGEGGRNFRRQIEMMRGHTIIDKQAPVLDRKAFTA